MRNLILILGDQLNTDSAALDDFDPSLDSIWMAEVAYESTKVWSSKPRDVVFLSAMRHCRFDPAESTGPTACPITTLYWDFLLQYEPALRKNQRMSMQVRNLSRLDEPRREAIRAQAAQLRSGSQI